MVTWHLVVTKSARGSRWFMHRCFRLHGMKSSSWACVEHAGLLDRAQVSRHSRSCKQNGPPLYMQRRLAADMYASRTAFMESHASRCGQGRSHAFRHMMNMQNVGCRQCSTD